MYDTLFAQFALVTSFEYDVATVPKNSSWETYVGKLDMEVPMSAELLDFYQHWSMTMDTRITPNFEVVNNTHGKVAGVWLGNREEWTRAVRASSACVLQKGSPPCSAATLNASDLIEAMDFQVDYTRAIVSIHSLRLSFAGLPTWQCESVTC